MKFVLIVVAAAIIAATILLAQNGFLDRSITVSKPTSIIDLGPKTFASCKTLIDADVKTVGHNNIGLPPYDKIVGKVYRVEANYPIQIEGKTLFFTGVGGRRDAYEIFLNDVGFLGAAMALPSVYGPSTGTFIMNKSTGIAVFTETSIVGGSNEPYAGVSYMFCD